MGTGAAAAKTGAASWMQCFSVPCVSGIVLWRNTVIAAALPSDRFPPEAVLVT